MDIKTFSATPRPSTLARPAHAGCEREPVPTSQTRAVVLNSLSMLLPLFVNLAVVFILSPLMVQRLGNRDYGIWELLLGVVGYLGILDVGIGSALVRYVSLASGREDRRALEETLNTGLLALTLAGSVAFLILGVLPFLPAWLSPLPPQEAGPLTPLLLLFGGNLLISFPNSAMGAYLLGLQKHRFLNIYLVASGIVEAVAVYFILVSDAANKLVLLCLMKLLFSVTRAIIYFVWIISTNVRITLWPTAFRWSLCRQLVAFGVKNTMLGAAHNLIRTMILLVITHFVGVAAIVFFVIPNRLIEYAYGPADALGHPLLPLFTALAAKGDAAATRAAWLRSTRLLQVVTIGGPLALIWLGEPFIRRWMGSEYASLGYVPLLILAAGLLVKAIAVNATRLLMSLARHGRVALFSAGAAIAFFLLSIPLTQAAGIAGAALSVALFMATVGWWEIVSASRELGISPTTHIGATLTRFAAPCAVASLVFKLLQSYAYPTTYPSIVFHGIVGGGAYLILATLLTLSREDRQFLRGLRRATHTERRMAAIANHPHD